MRHKAHKELKGEEEGNEEEEEEDEDEVGKERGRSNERESECLPARKDRYADDSSSFLALPEKPARLCRHLGCW